MTRAAEIAAGAMACGARQDERELAAAITLAAAAAPRVIAEIGCDAGGTLYAWTRICPRVYGITLADNSAGTGGSGGRLDSHGAVVLAGDSHDPASPRWLARVLAGDPVDVLVIDGDHSEAGVRRDLAMYGDLVRPGGLILLHDVHNTGDPCVHVAAVWPALAAAYDTSEIGSGPGWGVIRVREGDTFSEAGVRDG